MADNANEKACSGFIGGGGGGGSSSLSNEVVKSAFKCNLIKQ